jgi:hypothetical protein
MKNGRAASMEEDIGFVCLLMGELTGKKHARLHSAMHGLLHKNPRAIGPNTREDRHEFNNHASHMSTAFWLHPL